jgi:TfoX/Sxy family transcriptional regulator of competence genes
MAFDPKLAERVRGFLMERTSHEEKKMFGGLAFMVQGRMCCGVMGDRLMVRVPHDGYEALLEEPHVSEMDFTGRPLKGMIYVDAPGLTSKKALTRWVDQAVQWVEAQPEQAAKKPRAARKR